MILNADTIPVKIERNGKTYELTDQDCELESVCNNGTDCDNIACLDGLGFTESEG